MKNYSETLLHCHKGLFQYSQMTGWTTYYLFIFLNDLHAEVVDEVLFIVHGHTIETLYNGSTRLTI